MQGCEWYQKVLSNNQANASVGCAFIDFQQNLNKCAANKTRNVCINHDQNLLRSRIKYIASAATIQVHNKSKST